VRISSRARRSRRDCACDQRFETIGGHQHVQRGLRRAARARHVIAQCRRAVREDAGELGGSCHDATGEPQGEVRRQPLRFTRPCQHLDQQKDIGRTASGHRSHRVDQRLVLDPGALADRSKQPIAKLPLLPRHTRVGASNGDRAPDRGRRVGHRTDERSGTEMAAETGQRLAGHDRNENGFRAYPAPVKRQYRVDDLRLDSKDHGIRYELARQRVCLSVPFYKASRTEPERHPLRLDDEKAGSGVAGEPAAEHGRPHLTAADKDQTPACSFALAHARLPFAQASPTGSIIAEAIA